MTYYVPLSYPAGIHKDTVFNTLLAIRENDGYIGCDVPEKLVRFLVPTYARVEVSEITGLILRWTLTTAGKGFLRQISAERRQRKRKGFKTPRSYSDYHPPVVALTIEVLDALKAIYNTGHPQTEKLDVVARIQLGRYATQKDGKWELSREGEHRAVNHIRKTECAQFSGKVQ